jgi:hypothetical protein
MSSQISPSIFGDPQAGAVQRRKRARRRLRRAALRPQRVQQHCYVIDGQGADGQGADGQGAHSSRLERRQEVMLEVVAMGLERAWVALAGADLGLEALEPPTRNMR